MLIRAMAWRCWNRYRIIPQCYLRVFRIYVTSEHGVNSMKRLALLSLLALASCATSYQPQSLTGGFSDYMTAPDEAIEMSNNERSLEPLEMVINGQKARPKDAAFLSNSLRQFLGIKS